MAHLALLSHNSKPHVGAPPAQAAWKAMVGNNAMPALFFAPFVSSTMRIEPQWIDYNGHLNMAYHHVLFDRAVEEAFSLVGLGPEYVAERNASFFAAECHVRYLRELRLEHRVRITLQLIAHDAKRLHFILVMREASDGWAAATAEHLSLHVDLPSRKVVPFPPDIMANLAVMKAAHSRLDVPDIAGRAVSMARASQRAEPETSGGHTHH
jgi:acyl-CoA thioester hydrolase